MFMLHLGAVVAKHFPLWSWHCLESARVANA